MSTSGQKAYPNTFNLGVIFFFERKEDQMRFVWAPKFGLKPSAHGKAVKKKSSL